DRHGVGRENVGRQPFAQVLFRAGEGRTAVPEASVAEQQSEQIRRKQERTAAGREFDRGNERNPVVQTVGFAGHMKRRANVREPLDRRSRARITRSPGWKPLVRRSRSAKPVEMPVISSWRS